jgi:FkbH-like protein
MSLHQVLRDVRPTPASYLDAARKIDKEGVEGLRPLNVAILSTYTTEVLRPYLQVESAAKGLLVSLYFAPFNQLEQQVLDDNSDFYKSSPDVVIIAARIEEMNKDLIHRYVNLSSTEIDEHLENIQSRIQNLLGGLRPRSTAAVLVFNFADIEFHAAGLADASLERSQASMVQSANDRLAGVCSRFTDVHVFDYARIVREHGLRAWSDLKLWYLAKIPFGAQAQLELGRRLARHISAVFSTPCKCLVVDLDNTLWGGVIGEDGIGGILLGEDYPGNVYKEFQRRLVSLKDQGFLIAAASKNNETDAKEVFDKHPDCLLNTDDFAAFEVNWEDKVTSLRKISKDLNIDIDALAFFDDNPAERAWVASNLPEVTVIDVPDSPLGFARALDESGAFDRLSFSEEDQMRSTMYQENKERNRAAKASVSVDDFLRQLEMTATIGCIGPDILGRVAELVGKTNQFNLTTRRYTASELQKMNDAGSIALWMRVADRFGDNGLVGVAIAVPMDYSRWNVDVFVLSCRVIGRQVETVMLGVLSKMALDKGAQVLEGEYLPTPKNGICSNFYQDHGFKSVDAERRMWEWDFSRGEVPLPEIIEMNFDNDGIN